MVADDELQKQIRDELAEVGAAGMDPVVLASRVEATFNDTVDVLDAMIDEDDVEQIHRRSYQGRYRLVGAAPEVE